VKKNLTGDYNTQKKDLTGIGENFARVYNQIEEKFGTCEREETLTGGRQLHQS
jgi:hypothetical protein